MPRAGTRCSGTDYHPPPPPNAVRDAQLPVTGVDFLVDEAAGKAYVIELAPDLAISPRSGKIVAEKFIDYLFPETKHI